MIGQLNSVVIWSDNMLESIVFCGSDACVISQKTPEDSNRWRCTIAEVLDESLGSSALEITILWDKFMLTEQY